MYPTVHCFCIRGTRKKSGCSIPQTPLTNSVVRYLSGTTSVDICYPKSDAQSVAIVGYNDSDWDGCKGTRKSITDILETINNRITYWTSKCQLIVCLCSAEEEYVAVSHCAKQMK